MSCNKPTIYQNFRRTGTIPPCKSSSQNYKKRFLFRQYSHPELSEIHLASNETCAFVQPELSQTKKKNGISGKIANRKKPKRRPTSHVVSDEEITKQVMRSASVVFHALEERHSERSMSVPTSTTDVLVTDKELKKIALKYQKTAEVAKPRIRKSLIPVLKNSAWKRPSCRIIDN